LEIHPQTIVEIVLQAIKPVAQSQKITIYVSRKDKEILEANKSRIKDALEYVENFSIQERDDVPSGGCIIETPAGTINASLENQFRALESAFETFMKS
jgi:type III secretion protein L